VILTIVLIELFLIIAVITFGFGTVFIVAGIVFVGIDIVYIFVGFVAFIGMRESVVRLGIVKFVGKEVRRKKGGRKTTEANAVMGMKVREIARTRTIPKVSTNYATIYSCTTTTINTRCVWLFLYASVDVHDSLHELAVVKFVVFGFDIIYTVFFIPGLAIFFVLVLVVVFVFFDIPVSAIIVFAFNSIVVVFFVTVFFVVFLVARAVVVGVGIVDIVALRNKRYKFDLFFREQVPFSFSFSLFDYLISFFNSLLFFNILFTCPIVYWVVL